MNSINGLLTFKGEDSVGIETGGIEWSIDTSSSTLAALPSIGSPARLYTYLHHVQDSMKLYGFGSPLERRLFLALISANGVGPSLARKILSGITAQRLITALDQEDLETLAAIPGLGKKTAQKIILQLRGKLTDDQKASGSKSGKEKEVVSALVAMGFDAASAAKAISFVLSEDDLSGVDEADREGELLRRAIIALSS